MVRVITEVMEVEIQETMATGKALRHIHLIMVPGQVEADVSKLVNVFDSSERKTNRCKTIGFFYNESEREFFI